MSDLCYDDIDQNCDECYELTQEDCLPEVIQAGLTPAATYWLWCIAPDGNYYKDQITIAGDGSFTIDVDSGAYPTGLFNKYAGKFEFFLSNSQTDPTPVAFSISAVSYNCLIMNWTVNCCDNTYIPPTDCEKLLDTLSEDELNTCILPTYDFSDAVNVQPNVTAQQQTDLQAWLCVGADATVENSDQSYQTTVPCGDTLVLPDITVTDQDGGTSSIPSVQNVDIRDYKSGIAYQRPMVAIQSTSYNLYDAGWRLANTVRPSQPPYPISYAELDWTALNPFITLKENNAFGNKNRFTDELGTQVYATSYAIDHLTGYGIALITPTSANWATALSNINSLTHATFSDYFMPTLDEFNSVCDMEINNTIGYSPLSIFSSGLPQGTDFWTSATDSVTTANAQTVQPDLGGGSSYNMRRQAKTAIHYYLPMRYHY